MPPAAGPVETGLSRGVPPPLLRRSGAVGARFGQPRVPAAPLCRGRCSTSLTRLSLLPEFSTIPGMAAVTEMS